MHNELMSTSPRYSIEETGRIIERATEISHNADLTYDQLLDVAAELGIGAEAVDEALATIQHERPPSPVPLFQHCLEVLCLKPTR